MGEEGNENGNCGRLSRSETITVLSHYYRAESGRSLAWRQRLDRTINWAVGAAAAFIGFAFSHPEIPHGIFLFALLLVYSLLFVEARRYRFYDAYEYRVRLLHQHFIYGVLTGKVDLAPESFWVAELASDLRYPQYKMSFGYALARRFKATYVYVFAILLACWLLKIAIHPATADSWKTFADHASLEVLPGWATFLFIILFIVHGAILVRYGSRCCGGRDIVGSTLFSSEA